MRVKKRRERRLEVWLETLDTASSGQKANAYDKLNSADKLCFYQELNLAQFVVALFRSTIVPIRKF